jgi:hypothetical protein
MSALLGRRGATRDDDITPGTTWKAQHVFLVVVTAAGGNTTMQMPASVLGEAGVLMTQTKLDNILHEYRIT